MDNKIWDRKILAIIDIIIFILSLVYMIVYKQSLEEISNMSYDITYKVIYASVVIPCLYFSISSILTLVVSKCVLMTISKKMCIIFTSMSFVGILFYIFMMILHFIMENGNSIYYFLGNKTYIFAVLGIMMSLGACKNNYNK